MTRLRSNSAAAPDANRAAGVASAVLFRVRLAPVSGKPLGGCLLNERQGFTILPIASASPELQDAVAQTIQGEKVLEQLPQSRSVFVWVGDEISKGSTLEEAHASWTALYVNRTKTPGRLPRQPADARTPDGIVRVIVECIDRRSGGMGSHYGFEGYYASLLLLVAERRVWDARGEQAS